MANTEQNAPSSDDPFLSLSQPQLIAIEHIANGSTHTQAAEAAGVCRETISRWKRVPVFEAELNRRRREVRDETTDMVRNLDGTVALAPNTVGRARSHAHAECQDRHPRHVPALFSL